MQLTRFSDTKTALGGPATLAIVATFDTAKAEQLLRKLWADIFYFEKKFSRFLPSSELSRFNKKAGTRAPVSPAMRNVLVATKAYSDKTGNLYNPFILPALQRAGYKNSALAGYEDDPAPDYTDRHVVSGKELEIGDEWAHIPHGTALDLGGMGKGYLLDELASTVDSQAGIVGYWFELSGDIITFGHDENGEAIGIGIQNAAHITSKHAEYQIVGDGTKLAIATSGTFRRKAHDNNDTMHHIIDPRTGKAASTDILLATVCQASALAADILASCAVIVGSAEAEGLMTKHKVDSWMVQYKSEDEVQYAMGGKHIKKVAHA